MDSNTGLIGLDKVLEGRVEVIDSLDTLNTLEIEPRKVYWLRGSPRKSNKNLLILYQTKADNPFGFDYDVIPYGRPQGLLTEMELDLKDGFISLRHGGKGAIHLDRLADLRYLGMMQELDQRLHLDRDVSKPEEWPINDMVFTYFDAILQYIEDRDIAHLDIVLVSSGLNIDHARGMLLSNHYSNHFRQQTTMFARQLTQR